MTNDQGALPRQSQLRTDGTLRPVFFAAVSLLVLTWTGTWLLDLGDGVALAASLLIGALALIATGIRIAFRRKEVTPAVPAHSLRRASAHELHDRWVQAAPGHDTEKVPTAVYGKRWTPEVFAAIDAQRFAAVCETWFSWAGFDTRSESHRTDEGVDIWLHAAKMPGPVAVVRCKHWLDKPVGLQEMKDFLGLVATFESAHGTYTTTSTYTTEALQFAKEHGIDAVDGRGLLRRIQTRTRQHQLALLAVAYQGHG